MDISLNFGERICDKCNGKGSIVIETIEILEKCKYCNGEKIITWIDNIIGKNSTYYNNCYIHDNIQKLQYYLEHYCRLNGLVAHIEITPYYEQQNISYRGNINVLSNKSF